MAEKPIGLLGGTFDPVHIGHLRLALECLEAADLAVVRLVPLHTPPHRGPVRAVPGQRLHMLRLAVAGMERLEVAGDEVERGGISYTIDTVSRMRQAAGQRPLCLIMGLDAFEGLDSWRQWELILDKVHIIVADRPGGGPGITNPRIAGLYAERQADTHDIHHSQAGRIIRVEIPPLSVSSTRIRNLLVTGGHPEFLLPESVLTYIREHKLYSRTP